MRGSLSVRGAQRVLQTNRMLKVQRNGLNIRNGELVKLLKVWESFVVTWRYDGGVDSAVVAKVRCAWKKFRELFPIKTFKSNYLFDCNWLFSVYKITCNFNFKITCNFNFTRL